MVPVRRLAGLAALFIFLLAAGTLAARAEVFPPSCAGPLPAGWSTPGGATTGWSIVADETGEGACSLRSNAMSDAAA